MKKHVLLLLALTACLDVPEPPAVECASTDECDTAHGEVCDEGTCYGNPPAGVLAAVVSPPGDRSELVPREVAQLSIAPDGTIDDLALERAVTLAGRVQPACPPLPAACEPMTIDATITVTRHSAFAGGPGFRTVVMSSAGAAESSFSVALPPTHANDEPYVVTIVPAGRGDAPPTMGTTPAQVVPPMRIVTSVDGDMTRTFELGGVENPVIEGHLYSATANGLGYHRVVALGRWEAGAPATEVSTVAYTGTDGAFRLVLAANLVGNVEIVAKPYADLLEPTLHLAGVPATQSSTRDLVQPDALGLPQTVTVPLSGIDGNGQVSPVRGARVRVSATLDAPKLGDVSATFTAEGTTNDAGLVQLEILDGAAFASQYRLEVVPQAASNIGVVFDQPLVTYLAPLQLPTRVAMTGVVTDSDGNPVKDVAVTARPSLRFLWSLDDAPQAFISGIPAATTTTSETGEYVLWVDPMILGTWGRYDLVFEPPAKSRAPAWVKPDVEIPSSLEIASTPMTQIQLPDAAYVRGTVTAPDGQVLTGAEVKVFRMTDPSAVPLCSQVQNAPVSCPIPASLLGRGTSDDKGVVRLGLPR